MRERVLSCDKFEFISILEVNAKKSVNEHVTFYIKGHIAKTDDDYVMRTSAGQGVTFTASSPDGEKKIFSGIISNISIHNENEMRVLTLEAVSRSILMDIELEIRTFQDDNMTYEVVTSRMEEKNSDFKFMWPKHGSMPIKTMTVQYKETDWHYCNRLASRLGTVVVPDYLLDNPYISIGMPKRPAKSGIDAISYTMQKDVRQFRDSKSSGGFSERDAIYYIVKSREIYDLCDPIPFLDMPLYVYSITTRYEGDELMHYYTLKEESGFHTKRIFNENLIGVSLRGKVIQIKEDVVRVKIDNDVKQTEHKWFPYATPFSQPDGYGWYFMPEIGDEIRLQFPSEIEYDAYVSSAVQITHGNRMDPKIKFIRTIYGQIIQLDPEKILIDDGVGSTITMHKNTGIAMETNKNVRIDAKADITVSALGKVVISGQGGVTMKKGGSVVNIDNAIDISSEHTRVQ